MAYQIDKMAEELRQILAEQQPADCSMQLCEIVQRALLDDGFVETHLQSRSDGEHPRAVLYEDPDLGFCICGHVYSDAAEAGPHDHGTSWAVYGQADGETEMTDWKIVDGGRAGTPVRVQPERRYTLKRGDAHFYDVGAVHSPKRVAPTRLIRVEGANLDNVQRSKIERA